MAAIGTVHLNTHNPDKLTTYYTERIGLQHLGTADGITQLGVGNHTLLALHHTPDAPHAPRTAGLFHFALLVPTRADLGAVLQHLIASNTRLSGASDHAVSEALYLTDPEGNGIEIYRDRPREDWYDGDRFLLTTVALDADGVLADASDRPWSGLPDGTTMGHVHLHVADITDAEAFYTDVLDMDIMMNVGSASFISYDGYHHHLGVNIWGGRKPAQPGARGLRHWELHLAPNEYDKVLSRLADANWPVEHTSNGISVSDPSGVHVAIHNPADT
ncbi:MAG: VOC family protein [Chloroflexota bacterium]